jgi:glutamate synthase (NADPH/NADH) small chain
VGTKIPNVVALIREGKQTEAAKMLFENNPLTAITGAVCPNHLYCRGGCILGKKGNAVDFSVIEREVSKRYLNKLASKKNLSVKPAEHCKNFVIVGAGAAGLSIAYFLKKEGHDVTVYEREEKSGGMLRYGIPDFRLDKKLIDKVTLILEKMGVEFHCNETINITNPSADNADAVILAIGASVPKKLGIEGEDNTNVRSGIEYLKSPTAAKNVIVIGGGNVAIDCALMAAHMEATSVNLCYRRDIIAMKAYGEELELARKKGIVFNFHMVPKKFTSEGVVFEREGEVVFMPADLVVVAVGQNATDNGMLVAEDYKTNIEKVYAVGDAVTGTISIIKAVAGAKELASKLMEQSIS